MFRRILLGAVAVGGLVAIAQAPAMAAPATPSLHVAQAHPAVTQVDYYWHHRHWHHRRWQHNRWRYYD